MRFVSNPCLFVHPQRASWLDISLLVRVRGAFVCAVLLALAGCRADAGPVSEDPGPEPIGIRETFAAPGGWSGGDGSRDNPFDLATALSQDSPAKPGSTVWLRGGTYLGSFTGNLTGTADAPIVVRSFPGEHVVIDAGTAKGPALVVRGRWAHYRDFEVMSSNAARTSNTGIVVHGDNTKVINTVIHDFTGGIAIWRDAVDSELYGNVIYYNGWFDASDNHPKGHGIYTQSDDLGTRRIAENIVFSQFGAGLHAYGSSDSYLDNMVLEGNIIFNNGIPTDAYATNILIGGGRPAKAPVLKSNYTWSWRNGDNNIGFDRGCDDLVMKDNYFVHSEWAFQIVNCAGTIEDNFIYGPVRAIESNKEVQWPELQKRYPKNQYLAKPTEGFSHFVRPNTFEPGRAHVIVFNWGKESRLTLDLSAAGIQQGHRFQLVDVQNPGGEPVASGRYSGQRVTVSMGSLTETAPIIGHPTKPPHSAPEFAVFLLTSGPPPPSWLGSLWTSVFGLTEFIVR